MAKRRIITLLSDFGTRDGYVASMKGVLLSVAEAQLVDISHEIPPGDVLAGAFVLRQVFDYFPPGTVHLAVVDPGVGTDRRILAARYAGQTVVAPDNGLLSLLDGHVPLEEIVSVRNEQYFLSPRVGRTFDGRDVMAPAAALLAGGESLARLGPPPETYKLLELPANAWDGRSLRGQVLYVDRFGNCISSLTGPEVQRHLPRLAAITVRAKERTIGPLHGTYAHVPAGEPLALLDSLDRVEIAVNGGSARDALGLAVGDPVELRYHSAAEEG